MRVSVSGTNGSSRARLSFSPEEVTHLATGLDDREDIKIKVEGSVVTGVRVSAGSYGTKLQLSGGHGYIELPTTAIEAVHEPVGTAEVYTFTERDDFGPVVRSAPFPVPFAMPDQRRLAKQRLEEFTSNAPRASSEALFKGGATVKREEKKPTPWKLDHSSVNKTQARRVAIISCCECDSTQEMGLNSLLPDAVISKKFKAQGWHIWRAKAKCPDCMKKVKKQANLKAPPADMIGVLTAVTQHRVEADLVSQLKASIYQINTIMDALGDSSVKLLVSKNRLSAARMVAL